MSMTTTTVMITPTLTCYRVSCISRSVYGMLRSCLDRSEAENVPQHASMDDIRTEFHPHARIATRIDAFSDFTRQHNYEPPHPDRQPWLPFRCQLDFEVAELAHETALTHEQTTRLIQLVQHGRTEDFTLKNYADVRNTWEAASYRLTPVSRIDVCCCKSSDLFSLKRIPLQYHLMATTWNTQSIFAPFGIGE